MHQAIKQLCDASCEQEKEPGDGTVRAWSSLLLSGRFRRYVEVYYLSFRNPFGQGGPGAQLRLHEAPPVLKCREDLAYKHNLKSYIPGTQLTLDSL